MDDPNGQTPSVNIPNTEATPNDSGNYSVQTFDISPDMKIVPVSDPNIDKPVTAIPAPVAPTLAPKSINLLDPENQPDPEPEKIPQIPIPQIKPIPPETIIPAPQPAPVHIDVPVPKKETPVTVNATQEKSKIHYSGDSVLKPIRTYEGDVADIMSHRNISVTTIAMAEEQKRKEDPKVVAPIQDDHKSESHIGFKVFMVILSLLLVGGGLVGAYYLYSKSPVSIKYPTPTPTANTPSSIVSRDSYVLLPIDNLNQATIISRIKNEIDKNQPAGTIKEIIPIVTDTNSNKLRISTSDMIGRLNITATDILTRTLTPQWMLGVYSDQNGQKSVFVIVTTNFFQNAFAGMLQWERVMADDLRLFVAPPNITGISNTDSNSTYSNYQIPSVFSSILATSTLATTSGQTITSTSSSSTQAIPEIRSTLQGRFQDRIIRNKDVRAFILSDGNTLFLYSFIDNSHLVVTNNEKALYEILTRLEKQAFIR